MKQTFPIVGMHCAGCAANLTKAILKVPGVKTAKVTYSTNKAAIEYDQQQIDWQALTAAVASVGSYQIILPETSADHPPHDHAAALEAKAIRLLKQKTTVSGLLTVIVLFGAWLKVLPNEIIFVLTSVVMFYAGKEFFVNTWLGLKTFSANMDTLIAIGTGAAYLYSSIVTFYPHIFTSPQPVYFETAAAIITLILLGRYLEAIAKGKASEAIKKLLNLQVKKAIVLRGGQEVEVDINQVKKGDHLLVKPGAKVPVDGIIIKGQSYLDESLVTGESKPVKKGEGDKVIGSTINRQGLLVIKATGVGEDTLLAQIVKLVDEAQSSQAPIQKLADKVSSIFVPVVILIAALAFLVWHFALGLAFSPALVIAITILIVSCPCALGLATPISIMVGTGRGAQVGILIKNAEKLQIAGSIKAIVFDKTGTLTKGSFSVTDIVPAAIKPQWRKKDILKLAASLEQGSEHPIAEAIVAKAKAKNLPLNSPKQFSGLEGKGVKGIVAGKKLLLGTRRLMEEKNVIRCTVLDEKVARLSDQGKSTAYLSVNNRTVAALALEDEPKPIAKTVVAQLMKKGLAVWMITGDNQQTGAAIGKRLGIKNVLANVLPQDKVMAVKKLQQQYPVVAMVGDGVNDAPALAQADVGIAMATGTDVAIEAGDITLLRGDLRLISKAITLSQKTMTNIKQNLFWAFGYNILLIPIAAGILKPLAITISPIFASAAMAFSSLSVVSNALRLKKIKL
jgi:Cu+-exporting ATPase